MILEITPPTPPTPPIIYFMIIKYINKIRKHREMVRNKVGGVVGGVINSGGGKLFEYNIYSFEVFY